MLVSWIEATMRQRRWTLLNSFTGHREPSHASRQLSFHNWPWEGDTKEGFLIGPTKSPNSVLTFYSFASVVLVLPCVTLCHMFSWIQKRNTFQHNILEFLHVRDRTIDNTIAKILTDVRSESLKRSKEESEIIKSRTEIWTRLLLLGSNVLFYHCRAGRNVVYDIGEIGARWYTGQDGFFKLEAEIFLPAKKSQMENLTLVKKIKKYETCALASAWIIRGKTAFWVSRVSISA